MESLALSLTSRERLSVDLLDFQYRQVEENTKKALECAESVALVSDRWSCHSGHMINVIATSRAPFFLTGIDTKRASETGDYLS